MLKNIIIYKLIYSLTIQKFLYNIVRIIEFVKYILDNINCKLEHRNI